MNSEYRKPNVSCRTDCGLNVFEIFRGDGRAVPSKFCNLEFSDKSKYIRYAEEAMMALDEVMSEK